MQPYSFLKYNFKSQDTKLKNKDFKSHYPENNLKLKIYIDYWSLGKLAEFIDKYLIISYKYE
jgi:hypothetical protein